MFSSLPSKKKIKLFSIISDTNIQPNVLLHLCFYCSLIPYLGKDSHLAVSVTVFSVSFSWKAFTINIDSTNPWTWFISWIKRIKKKENWTPSYLGLFPDGNVLWTGKCLISFAFAIQVDCITKQWLKIPLP